MEHELTTAYSSEENGIVEKGNKEVMSFLRGIIFDDRIISKWSNKQIPLVRRILNTQEHSRTGVTPAESDRAILRPNNGPKAVKRLHEHMEMMLSRQRELIKVASELQLANDQHHIATHEPNGITEYAVTHMFYFHIQVEGRINSISSCEYSRIYLFYTRFNNW